VKNDRDNLLSIVIAAKGLNLRPAPSLMPEVGEMQWPLLRKTPVVPTRGKKSDNFWYTRAECSCNGDG